MRNVSRAVRSQEEKADGCCDGERSDAHENDAVYSPDTSERADCRGDPEVAAAEMMRGDNAEHELQCGESNRTAGGK